jgi:GTP cyclohydrolase II
VPCESPKSIATSGIQEQASTRLPTRFGVMRLKVYRNNEGTESIVIVSGSPEGQSNVAVRVHSACLTAEVLGSLRCDCKSQLDYALQYIADHGGIIIYLPQEGRGVGLINKIRAYALQDQGFDTVDANRELGLPDDARDYADAARILEDLQVRSIRLLTNNPLKISGLEESGVNIRERVPLPLMVTEHSIAYLKTKHTRMGHLLEIAGLDEKPEVDHRPMVHVNLAKDGTAKREFPESFLRQGLVPRARTAGALFSSRRRRAHLAAGFSPSHGPGGTPGQASAATA